jgi:hypothetical protein
VEKHATHQGTRLITAIFCPDMRWAQTDKFVLQMGSPMLAPIIHVLKPRKQTLARAVMVVIEIVRLLPEVSLSLFVGRRMELRVLPLGQRVFEAILVRLRVLVGPPISADQWMKILLLLLLRQQMVQQ